MSDFDRPWLGRRGHPHTYFYHDRYGAGVAELIRESVGARAAGWTGRWRINVALVAGGAPELAADRWDRLRVRELAGGTPAGSRVVV